MSTYRGPLSEQSIYLKVCAATEEELGVRLNPHLFRDALATGIATDDPEHIRMASRLLGHADQRTAERHYTHAQALRASRPMLPRAILRAVSNGSRNSSG